jgi:hypothetical protein
MDSRFLSEFCCGKLGTRIGENDKNETEILIGNGKDLFPRHPDPETIAGILFLVLNKMAMIGDP